MPETTSDVYEQAEKGVVRASKKAAADRSAATRRHRSDIQKALNAGCGAFEDTIVRNSSNEDVLLKMDGEVTCDL
jgi:hypothetical protein